MPFESGWIYHLDFGWVYVVESHVRGLWMWMQDEVAMERFDHLAFYLVK